MGSCMKSWVISVCSYARVPDSALWRKTPLCHRRPIYWCTQYTEASRNVISREIYFMKWWLWCKDLATPGPKNTRNITKIRVTVCVTLDRGKSPIVSERIETTPENTMRQALHSSDGWDAISLWLLLSSRKRKFLMSCTRHVCYNASAKSANMQASWLARVELPVWVMSIHDETLIQGKLNWTKVRSTRKSNLSCLQAQNHPKT